MQSFFSSVLVITILPFLANSLKIQPKSFEKETYASYAAKNGIKLEKSADQPQSMTCYDYFGQQGNSYRVTNFDSDLSYNGWDNKFSSCCFYGIWTLYQDALYNEDNPNVSLFKNINLYIQFGSH